MSRRVSKMLLRVPSVGEAGYVRQKTLRPSETRRRIVWEIHHTIRRHISYNSGLTMHRHKNLTSQADHVLLLRHAKHVFPDKDEERKQNRAYLHYYIKHVRYSSMGAGLATPSGLVPKCSRLPRSPCLTKTLPSKLCWLMQGVHTHIIFYQSCLTELLSAIIKTRLC